MTTADVETSKRRTPSPRTDASVALSTQLFDTADRTVSLVRTAAESALKVTDVIVIGAFGVAEEWAGATPVAGLALPPVKVAKETWTSTRDGLRDLVLAV
jgi:hypothetical protein